MVVSAIASQPTHALQRRIIDWLIRSALAALAVAAAFSAAQTPAASDTAPQPADGSRTMIPPERPQVDIALVLPLDAPAYARAAEAVNAGFVAAASGSRTSYVVISHAADAVLAAFDAARKSGAKVIVGPLIRDDLKAVVQADLPLPWMLALNRSEDVGSGPSQMFTFSLAVENDARTLARRMRDDAVQNVAIIAGESPLTKRFAGAFATQWLLEGGGAPGSFRFDPAPEALTMLKRDFAKTAPDAALLALDGDDALRAKPYLGTVAAYASGLMFDQRAQATLRDLDGLVIVEVPWLVTPGAPEFAKFTRREFGSASLDRLYAFGLDAFRIAQALVDGPPEKFEFEGATGRVTLAEGRQFVRDGRLAVFRTGQLVPLDGAR
jgi:outer membrane PBP1 activator LpoA protein